jgi:hypothetical protein
MKILEYELLTENELLTNLKKTRLRGFGQAELYRTATLEILEVDPLALVPAQRFVLVDTVRSIIELSEAFSVHGIDVFALRGGIRFWLEGSDPRRDAPIPFIPPVVEESLEPDGRTVLLINDGIHRVYAARKLGRGINIVLARNVPVEYPYYAYALPDGWASVEELSELRDGYQKKEYRIPDNYKSLFREFNKVDMLEGVQQQRKQTNPGHLMP